ncbi:21963_t:CDS:1, partial [Rhizophagus irregularis]
GSSILITKVVTSKAATSEQAKISFNNIKKFFDIMPSNILGWFLTVSDSENNIGLITISCITDEDINPKLKIRHRKLNRYA